ncbi:MAG: hypothetical protein HZB36_05350 [Candidatus Omnitrophica bacterium]|nr:hypothetical protein [Candidatus Omnitrophota bacterium]
MSSCEATYPARTMAQQLAKLAKEEEELQVSSHIAGKTLWVYVPLDDLIKEKDMSWNEPGLEKMSQILSIVHRVILSTDAKLDFAAVVASDIKHFGVQLTTFEYLPDVREAILERFSRGEFFMRSVKDVSVNPKAVGDVTGESMQYYDMAFDHFMGLQVVHRAKSIFAKDKTLSKIFELKTTSLAEKFGVIKIDFEFLKKTYLLTPEEEKINPLDYVKMIAAEIVRNYDYKNFQAFEIKDTFSGQKAVLDAAALKKIKIDLPEFMG